MAKYKIGATDGGDAGLDLSWKDKLDTVDGAVLITKRVTPAFIGAVKDLPNVVIHVTCTGYGGTVVEPNVPHPEEQMEAALQLISFGFPKERVVVRIDPMIPTVKGMMRATSVFGMFSEHGFSRYRVSLIDMYPHVRKRFADCGLPSLYGGGFSPDKETIEYANHVLRGWKLLWKNASSNIPLRIESCAEPTLTEAIRCGCVSEYDIQLMGLTVDDDMDAAGYQRRDCLCYSGKKELLNSRKPCPHQCLYCFWKDVK